MAGIKLGKLPDRTLVKLTISITPDLNHSLARYAEFYRLNHGQGDSVIELVPAIVNAFLESDRAFVRWCRDATGPNQ